MGRQHTVAALNFVGFWFVGISCGSAFAFGTDVGVAGLWWGLALGLFSTAGVGLILLLRTKFCHQLGRTGAVGAEARSHSGHQHKQRC